MNNSRFLNREAARSKFNARDLEFSTHPAVSLAKCGDNTLDLRKTTNYFFPMNSTICDSVILPFDSITYSGEGLLTLIHVLDQCVPTASTWCANIFTLHVSRNTYTCFSFLNKRKRTRSENIRMHSELPRSHQRLFAVFWRMPALIGSHSGMFRNYNEILHTPVVKQHSTHSSTAFPTWRCHRLHTPNRLLQIKWGLFHNHIIA